MASPHQTDSILAFDYGSKRIGVAACFVVGKPLPLTTVDATSDVWSAIGHLVRKHSPRIVVVGWPRGLDGQHTQQTIKAEQFAEEIHRRFGVEVKLQDEVLTSEEAEKRIDPKLPIKKRREQIDMIAAQIILEDYLGE